jgi:type I restriction enzyme S subunit
VSWPMVALGELFKVGSGGTPSRKEASYYEGGDIAWIKTGDLHEVVVQKASEYITQDGLDNSSAKLFPKNTVLVAMYGATIGACSILGIEAATNQACAAFVPTKKVDIKYLYYFLKSKKEDFVRDGVGGAQPNISATYLKTVEIPLPPLEIQKQIAAVLEKADQLRKDCKQMEQELNSLAQSVFIDMFVDQSSVKRVTVESSVELINGRAFKSTEWGKKGLPIIRIQNLKKATAKSNYYDGEYDKKHYIEKGCLLLSWAGQLVSFGVFVWGREPGLLNQHIFNVIPKLEFEQAYLKFALSEVMEKAKHNFSGIDMKHITKKDLNAYEIPYPSITLQKEFSLKIKFIDEQLKMIAVKKLESEEYFNSLMQKAFKGELSLKSTKKVA